MTLDDWASHWAIPPAALLELRRQVLGLDGAPVSAAEEGASESAAQAAVVLEASRKGIYLWRNNVGVLPDETGRPVRYGLANVSAAQNKVLKSADLIGVRPRVVRAEHVGQTWGIFTSREIKRPGWHYTGTGREPAQLAWANLILACGGDAGFATGRGTL